MSNEIVRIKGQLDCKVWQSESGAWIAVCDNPELTVQADTWAEMMESIHEGLEMVFHELMNTGEFDQFLADRGWVVEEPRDIGTDTEFDLPFVPELVGAHG